MSTRRRIATFLIVIATLTGAAGLVSLWAAAQVFDTEQWVDTSEELIETTEVREGVAAFLVDDLESSGALSEAELGGTAGSSGDLYGQIEQESVELLGTDPVVAAWTEANRSAHETFLGLIDETTDEASVGEGGVRLGLTEVQAGLVEALGLAPLAAGGEVSFQVVPLDRLDELRLFADVSRATPVVLLIVTLILYALALLIAAGCRRTVGFRIGISLLVVAGLGFLARLVGGLVVDSLISPGDQAEPGVDAVWSAATSLLVWLSSLTALAGLFIAIATWFAGRLGAERRQHSETAETA